MPRARARKQLEETPPAPTPPEASTAGFPQVAELVIPIPPPQPAGAQPDTPVEELAIPLKAKGSRRKAPKIEAFLAPIEPTPPSERQQCLALMMKTTGHSLDWGCRLCVTNCVYATPCGCGGWDCIDRRSGEQLVVFQETMTVRRKRARSLFRRSKARRAAGEEPLIVKLFKPWTWFARHRSKA